MSGKLRFVLGESLLTTFKELAGNIFWLRLAALTLSLCLVPAFMLGVVSVWSVLFAVIIGLRFRAGLIRLNEDIDRAENLQDILCRRRFYMLCFECVVTMLLALGIFYAIYIRAILPWSAVNARGVDAAMEFFDTLSFISFSDVISPYKSARLYLIAVSNILAYFVLFSLLAIAARSWWNYALLTWNSMCKKTGALGGIEADYAGIVGTISACGAFFLIGNKNYFFYEIVSDAKNQKVLIIFVIYASIFPFFTSLLLLAAPIRFLGPLLNFRNKQS